MYCFESTKQKGAKEMTIAQEWARKRNFALFRIRGIIATCNTLLDRRTTILTEKEQSQLYFIDRDIKEILINWDNKESKQNYLKERR